MQRVHGHLRGALRFQRSAESSLATRNQLNERKFPRLPFSFTTLSIRSGNDRQINGLQAV